MSGVESMAAVELRGIGKRFRTHTALRDVTLTLERGSVTGLVGPNGAGKTTLLGVLAGLLAPSEGAGIILGERASAGKAASVFVGLMPEHPAFIEHLSALANLRALAAIRATAGERTLRDALERVGLDASDRRPVKAYSQGMRQRLSLAQAIMERPRLLLLDEPANGLDPHGVVMLRDVVHEAAERGCAVVLSSHLLAEVETVANRVFLIAGGRVLRELVPGEPGSLEDAYLETIREGAA